MRYVKICKEHRYVIVCFFVEGSFFMHKKTIYEFGYITFAMLIISFAVHFFLVPSGIVVGSISGLSMVLNEITSLPISVITFILNIALLVIGFIFIIQKNLVRKPYILLFYCHCFWEYLNIFVLWMDL